MNPNLLLGGIIGLSGLSVVMGIIIGILGWKLGGKRVTIVELKQEVHGAHAQSSLLAKELKQRMAQLKALRVDIEELENDLEALDTRESRRARFERLLSKAEDRVPDGEEPELPGGGDGGGGGDADPDLGPGPHPDWV